MAGMGHYQPFSIQPGERLLSAISGPLRGTKNPPLGRVFVDCCSVQTLRLRLANPIPNRPMPKSAKVPGSGTEAAACAVIASQNRLPESPINVFEALLGSILKISPVDHAPYRFPSLAKSKPSGL